MSGTASYEVLSVESVPTYLAATPWCAERIDPATVAVREVGDGNLNLVFLCADGAGRRMCIKQSLPYLRLVGEAWPLTPDRAAAEARGYRAAMSLAPGLVPELYGFDEDRHVLAIEDLSTWRVWRAVLDDGQCSPGAAAAAGAYVGRMSAGTSVLSREPIDARADAAGAVNAELCAITEALVFDEPYRDHPNNSYEARLEPEVAALRADPGVLGAVDRLRWLFTTSSEALVHGDLHTGSVMVPPAGESHRPAAVIDCEFCFYGPIAFDLGALLGNYLLARARAAVLSRPERFQRFCFDLALESFDAFERELRSATATGARCFRAPRALDDLLEALARDAVGFGACKAVRRIVGLAKASDIETLTGEHKLAAASAVLCSARRWLLEVLPAKAASGRELVARAGVLASVEIDRATASIRRKDMPDAR